MPIFGVFQFVALAIISKFKTYNRLNRPITGAEGSHKTSNVMVKEVVSSGITVRILTN